MLTKFLLIGILVISLFTAISLVVTTPWTSGDETLASKVERAMREEATKPRFTGRLGDFELYQRTQEAAALANPFACKDGAVATAISGGDAAAAAGELWAPTFDTPEGVAWSCPDQGVVLVNNQGLEGATTTGEDVALLRGYFSSLPFPALRDAPRDRLELISVEGHPALIEHPIEGYPYGDANLVVIERYPADGKAGIVVVVEFASSAKRAVELAEEMIP